MNSKELANKFWDLYYKGCQYNIGTEYYEKTKKCVHKDNDTKNCQIINCPKIPIKEKQRYKQIVKLENI